MLHNDAIGLRMTEGVMDETGSTVKEGTWYNNTITIYRIRNRPRKRLLLFRIVCTDALGEGPFT